MATGRFGARVHRSVRIRHRQLPGHVVDHLGWHIRRIGQERAKEPNRGELHREPEPVVVTAPAGNQPQIGIIQKEATLQLLDRRNPNEPAQPRIHTHTTRP